MNTKVIPKNIDNIPWNKTPIFFNNGKYFNIRKQCELICGDTVFGKNKGLINRGVDTITDFLKRAVYMDVFKAVPSGTIIIRPPTREELVVKLDELCKRAFILYNKYDQILVTDTWSKRAGVYDCVPLNRSIPLHRRLMDSSTKRFKGEQISIEKQIFDLVKSSKGILAEGHVIAFLNSGLKCPICRVIGKIGWCDSISDVGVDSFRDAVCMNCRDNGIVTLFEIKTRWEKTLHGNGTYAGSFIALNTLMTIKANLYLVIASRDTGNVRIGRITSAKMRGNRNWLYSLQENLGWGGPSSFVTCTDGLHMLPVKMPILTDTMPEEYYESIFKEVLEQYRFTNKN